jgi:transposase
MRISVIILFSHIFLGLGVYEKIRPLQALIDTLTKMIKEYDQVIDQIAHNDPNALLLMTIPGVGPLLAVVIASEIGDIKRFASANDLVGYSGLCPRVIQSGDRDFRGKLTKHGPRYLRWALIMAAIHATKHPSYRDCYLKTVTRLGKSRGPKVGRVIVGRKLCNAIWYMLSNNMEFSPVLSTKNLAA